MGRSIYNLVVPLALVASACNGPGGSSSALTGAIDPWNAPVGAPVLGATLLDGWEDLREVPAPVNVEGGWTDSVAVSRNGKSLYFSYMTYDFAALVNTGAEVITGPVRTGMTGNKMKNFRADLGAGGWTVTYLPINGDSSILESSPAFNSSEDLLVFSRWSSYTHASLYYSEKRPDGTWSEPASLPAPFNSSACTSDNPFVLGELATGVDLYFESDRVDLNCTAGGGKRHIYRTHYDPISAAFSPVELVPGLNGTAPGDEDMQVYLSADGKTAYWTAVRADDYAIFTATWNGSAFSDAHPVLRGTRVAPFAGKLAFQGEANIAELPQGQIMYLMCGIAQVDDTTWNKQGKLKVCRARKPRR